MRMLPGIGCVVGLGDAAPGSATIRTRGRTVQMPKVFISYRHVALDEACAERLTAVLQQEGFDVFIDKRILTGQKWVEEIDRNLKSSDHFVVLLSAESIRSDMLRQEVADAHSLAGTGKLR